MEDISLCAATAKFENEKKSLYLGKILDKSKNCHEQNNSVWTIILKWKQIFFFFFQIYIEIWISCRVRLILIGDVPNIWFLDDIQKFKTRFLFEKYEPNKKWHEKIILYLNFTIISENFGPCKLAYWLQIQNFGESICSILYDTNLFK